MSYTLTQVVSPGKTYKLQLNQGVTGEAVDIWNASPFNLDTYGFGSPHSSTIMAGIGDRRYARSGNAGFINITANDDASIGGSGVVKVDVYNQGDIVPPGSFPVTIPTQKVQSQVTVANQLINSGFTPPTEVITITPSGQASPTFDVKNSGDITMATWDGTTYKVVEQILSTPSPLIQFMGDSVEISATGVFRQLLGATTVNGGGSGTASVYQWHQGTRKLLYIVFNTFNNGNVNQDITIPQAFTTFLTMRLQLSSGPLIEVISGGVSQSLNEITGVGVNGWTVTANSTGVHNRSESSGNVACDHIRVLAGVTSAVGFLIMEGI